MNRFDSAINAVMIQIENMGKISPQNLAAFSSSLKDLSICSLLEDLKLGKLKLVNNPLNRSQWSLSRSH
jgi:hypothetical protein